MQGWRTADDLTFSIGPVLDEAGITFKAARLERIAPDDKTLALSSGEVASYDKLIIATGGEWAWDRIPGSRPRPEGHTVSILSISDALNAQKHWQALLADPGPVVMAIGLDTSLIGAAYELALNIDMALRHEGKREAAEIVFVTPEPYLGHFGHNGIGNSRALLESAFAHRGIMAATEKQVSHVEETRLVAAPMQFYESRFTMLIPPYRGIKSVRETPGLADEDGLIVVDEYQRSVANPDIYAAGTAARIKPQSPTLLPLGRFVPGTVSAELGRIAARNVAADLGHGDPFPRSEEALKNFYVLDTGSEGLLLSLGSQPWLNVQLQIPGPWSHWAKSITERYQMWQLQTGKY
jgi:sulfide:quinone oxidoreductase